MHLYEPEKESIVNNILNSLSVLLLQWGKEKEYLQAVEGMAWKQEKKVLVKYHKGLYLEPVMVGKASFHKFFVIALLCYY